MLYIFQKTYECNTGSNNTTIYNSYKVTHIDEMGYIIDNIRKQYPLSSVNKRTKFSLINEWRAHNLLHTLGLYKDRTEHVDLNMGNNILYNIGYFIGSLLYLRY